MWEARQNQFGTYVVENGNCICSIEGDLNRADKMKNANLIAATPDLLELLIDAEVMINKSVSGFEKYSVIEWQLFLAKAQKVITKATGNNQ
jgi:hypothetical protein